ncbi:MAG: hypothetical protein Q7T55_22565 [Solirubrobacteraceae bacterium]|nr:hypothetical protein [Solirubrobacteraceae bacterium]
MPRISDTNSVTLSIEALSGAHFQAGDEVSIVADGRGRLIVERRFASDRRSVPRGTRDRRTVSGVDDGQYPRDYLLVTGAVRKRARLS